MNAPLLRRVGLALGLLLPLAAVNMMIGEKERLISEGRLALLPLAPVDPRSLMQGDYMVLGYDLFSLDRYKLPDDGLLALTLGDGGVVQDMRFYEGGALRPDEALIAYKRRARRLRLGAESYFFQEGQGDRFADAAYGALRLAPDGASVLVGLADEEGRIIPAKPPAPEIAE